MIHRCHAYRCKRRVPPHLLMCRPHWAMVPRAIQERVYENFWVSQCQDQRPRSRPTAEWLRAAEDAIKAVREREGS